MNAAGISVSEETTLRKFRKILDPKIRDGVLAVQSMMICGILVFERIRALCEADNGDGQGDNLLERSRERIREEIIGRRYGHEGGAGMRLCGFEPHADGKCMEYLVDDLAEGGLDISYVVADKGYDAEYVHVNIGSGFTQEPGYP